MKTKPIIQDKKYQFLLTDIGGAWYMQKNDQEYTTT